MLAIVLIVGVSIRVWQFGIIPGGINQDGAMAAVDGKALAEYGTDRFGTWLPAHLYAWGYGQMSSLLSYLIMISVKLFGFSTASIRLPQLIMSILGGVFLFFFAKDNFGKKTGLFVAFLVAFNPWHFLQSRWALDCNLLPHFFIIGLFFFSRGLIKNRCYFFYLSMLFFGLCMYCYGITIYTIPVFLLVISLFYIVKKRIRIRDVLISACIYMLVAWPFILTMAVNYFKWDTIELPFVTIQYFPDSIRSGDILLFSGNKLGQLITNVRSLLKVTLLQVKDLPHNDIVNFGTTYYFTTPFVLAGMICFPKLKVIGNKSLTVFALLTGVWVGVLTNSVNVNRINIIYYSLIIFAAIGIHVVVTEIRKTNWAVVLMYIVMAVFMLNMYFTVYREEISDCFYSGFGDALIKAESSDAERIFITADVQLKGNWRVSEILTLYYDKTDALYYQGKTNINNGREYLPYQERFVYESISADTVTYSKNESAAYVVMKTDKHFFDTDCYYITDFGEYCAVIKKNS